MGLKIPPCCADSSTSHCGLDSSGLVAFGPTFPEACQPLAQPGEPDASCADSAQTPVPGSTLTFTLKGCCRANHTCGYDLEKVSGIFQIGLGCVDSAPFLMGAEPAACGDAAGASGSAGAAGSSAEGGAFATAGAGESPGGASGAGG